MKSSEKIHLMSVCPFLIKIFKATKIFLMCKGVVSLKSHHLKTWFSISGDVMRLLNISEAQWEEGRALQMALKGTLSFPESSLLPLFPGSLKRNFLIYNLSMMHCIMTPLKQTGLADYGLEKITLFIFGIVFIFKI